MHEGSTSGATRNAGTTQLAITMRGPNIVIRSADVIDEGCAVPIASVVNAAAVTGAVVIIDPEPVRCDDAFARYEHASTASTASTCRSHASCQPVEAEVVNSRMIRLAAELDTWTIDVSAGRFCQASPGIHHLYLSPEAWVPIVAVIVTRTRLSALTTQGALITTSRAHRAA